MFHQHQIRHHRLAILFVALLLTFSLGSCHHHHQGESQTITGQHNPVTEQEIAAAQKAWGEGIVNIGKVYISGGDYSAAAAEHLHSFYNFQEEPVLFKPTLTSEIQFRTDFTGALSYFVAGNSSYPEDHGFAIKPWSNVRWENIGTKITDKMAVAMGNYYFTPAEGGEEVKVEYSFAYVRDAEGHLKIVLHDSHLPYSPPADRHH